MRLIGKISLVVAGFLFCISCECLYQDELDRAQNRKSSTGDVFYAEKLLGTWAVLLSYDYWRRGVQTD